MLDIGVGMGQYGFLLRTNLEHVGLFEVDGANARQTPRERWSIRIDGIEGYGGYLTPVHDYVYNDIHIGDALQRLPDVADAAYDLVLAIDVLEHFDVPQGQRFLAECRRVARRVALVSTPKDFVEQHVEANPFEDHRSHWSLDDLAAHGFGEVLPNDISWIAAWRRPAAA